MSIDQADAPNVWNDAILTARSRFSKIEEQDLARLIESQPEVQGPVEIRKFSTLTDGSGMSNGIAFFEALIDRGEGRKEHDLVLRYDPGVSLLKQKSFEEEFLTMTVARAAGLPVPEPMWLDRDGKILGTAGFVLERVYGEAPATAMYSRGPLADVSAEMRHAMMLEPAGFHGRLRKAAIGADQVPHLIKRGSGATAFERELNWWYREADLIAADDDPRLARIDEVRQWLIKNQPPLREATLIHGDAQHCNTIFADGKPAAVLDWELSHLGYAETDIVMLVLTTEILKVTDRDVDGTPSEDEYIARYEEESGHKVEYWPFFKLVMAYRYLVAQVFAASVLPNPEEMWALVDTMVKGYEAEARAAASSGWPNR